MASHILTMIDKPATSEDRQALLDGVDDALRRRLAKLDPRQVDVWRAMRPAERLEVAFQAYQFALDAVRATERQRHPDLSPEELAWRVTRRMQGDPRLGRGHPWSG